jgi:ankyrin repeat protein
MLGHRAAAQYAEQGDYDEHVDEAEREPKRSKTEERAHSAQASEVNAASAFRISVITMAGATIAIDNAHASDMILSVKRRVFAANRKMFVRRQRLVYSAGPHGIDPLADRLTLSGAGVAQDGSAKLDVLLADLTEADVADLGRELFVASRDGRSDDVLGLLDEAAHEGVNIDVEDEFLGQTALMAAAESGHANCVRLLIDAGADKETELHMQTALMLAAEKGHANCVRLLIDAGANKETKDMFGLTPLMQASENGHADCVRLLIDSGANKDAADLFFQTALHRAIRSGRTNWVRFLVDAGVSMYARVGAAALAHAAEYGQTDCARLLIDAGANKDFADSFTGCTALISAAMNGHVDCVQLLIDVGADTETTGRLVAGQTALIYAAERGHAGCVRLLIDAGANQDAQNCDGRTALHCSARNGHTDCARLLVNAGAGRQAVDKNGETALDLATNTGRDVIVRLLSEVGRE